MSGNHWAYQMHAITVPKISNEMITSGMNFMMEKINAALKSSDVFISYLAIVGNIVSVMSQTKIVKAITPNL